MKPVEARVEPEILDAIQVAQGKVDLAEFRLLPDCEECMLLAELPATHLYNAAIRQHARFSHRKLLK